MSVVASGYDQNQSATYNDMRRLLARETTAGAVTVEANLGFPEQMKDHYPAVIDCAIAEAATVEVAAVAAITFSRSRRFMLVPPR